MVPKYIHDTLFRFLFSIVFIAMGKFWRKKTSSQSINGNAEIYFLHSITGNIIFIFWSKENFMVNSTANNICINNRFSQILPIVYISSSSVSVFISLCVLYYIFGQIDFWWKQKKDLPKTKYHMNISISLHMYTNIC